MSTSPETNSNQNPEREYNPETLKEREKQQDRLNERLKENAERAGEKSKEDLDEARHEALEKAASSKLEKKSQEVDRPLSPAERRKDGPASTKELDAKFDITMNEVRSEMSAPSRAFSKVIHNKAVEKTSEALGSTVARPDAILSGAIFAFVLTLAVYLVAKNLGYPLSGFETIAAFAAGWIIGLVYDFLKVMITGRK